MGWVDEKFQDRKDSAPQLDAAAMAAESSFQRNAGATWAALLAGFKQDVAEFRRVTGKAEFDQRNDFECRLSNPQAGIAGVVTADLPAHLIRYSYEPEDSQTAVPEQGIFTLRASGESVELYSADQQVASEQARQLVLEPLLFPQGKGDNPAA
jgi:hypothetical protein